MISIFVKSFSLQALQEEPQMLACLNLTYSSMYLKKIVYFNMMNEPHKAITIIDPPAATQTAAFLSLWVSFEGENTQILWFNI